MESKLKESQVEIKQKKPKPIQNEIQQKEKVEKVQKTDKKISKTVIEPEIKPSKKTLKNKLRRQKKFQQQKVQEQKKKNIIKRIDDLENQFQKAEEIYTSESMKELKKYKMSKKDEKWLQQIMNSGTLRDKINALSIYIRDNPNSTIASVENLLDMALHSNKKESQLAIQSLKELFTTCLLPDRKLNSFLNNLKNLTSDPSEDQLRQFYFEHKIKEIYLKFINGMISKMTDPLFFVRKQLTEIVIELLSAKPENEELLLTSVINKFGDNEKKLIQFLNQKLTDFLMKHSKMTLVLIKEIERFILRPNNHQQAQFYAINFLNQLNLKKMDPQSIKELIGFFFILFQKILDLNSEELLASKILSQIIRGLNRVFSHTKDNFEEYEKFFKEKIDDLYKLINVSQNFKIKIQTLLFIFQIENQKKQLSDRYFRVLYDILLKPEINGTSLNELFFDILYFSLKADESIIRVQAFIKRLLQVALHSDPSFQITSLIFVGKIMKIHVSLKSMLKNNEKFFIEGENEEEEVVRDVENMEDILEVDKKQKKQKKYKKQVLVQEQEKKKQEEEKNKQKLEKNKLLQYDPFKRDPLFSKAENASLWELSILLNHYHPTVRKFSLAILNGQFSQLDYKGNPLLDFSLANFLDRLSFKKAKKKESAGILALKQKGKIRMSKIEDELSVDQVLKKDVQNMREEEKFFYRYFQQKQDLKKIKKSKKQIQQDIEEFADEFIEKEMEKGYHDEDDELIQELRNDKEFQIDEEDDELFDQNDNQYEDYLEDDEDQQPNLDQNDAFINEDDEDEDEEQNEDYQQEFDNFDYDEFDGLEEDIEDEDEDQEDQEVDEEGEFEQMLEKSGTNDLEIVEDFKNKSRQKKKTINKLKTITKKIQKKPAKNIKKRK